MSMQKFSFLSQKLWTCPPIYSLLTRDYPLFVKYEKNGYRLFLMPKSAKNSHFSV